MCNVQSGVYLSKVHYNIYSTHSCIFSIFLKMIKNLYIDVKQILQNLGQII